MKKVILTGVLVILPLLLISNVFAQTAEQLWPVQEGNEWTYTIEGPISNNQQFDLKVTRRSGGWAYIEGIDRFYGTGGWGNRWWWVSGDNGNIWVYNPTTYWSTRVFNLAVGTGNSFTSFFKEDICQDETVWRISDEHRTVTTPAGTFNNCVIIQNVQPVCADAGLTRMVFAPGVGIVEYSWTTFAGGHIAKLVHAIVDETEYPLTVQMAGYSVSMSINKITYTLTENRMPPIPPEGPPQQPDTCNVRLKIENKTDETISFQYRSSQEYDFIIRDDAGTEVYRWSHDKLFLTVITANKLDPGESLVYEEEIELRDLNGNPLQSGDYTIEGVHTTMNHALRQKVLAALTIELAVVN